MRYVIVGVRDLVADCFMPPNYAQSCAAAIRAFGDQVNRKEVGNLLAQHPADFELYELGSWDDQASDWEIFPKPRRLALARDLVVAGSGETQSRLALS